MTERRVESRKKLMAFTTVRDKSQGALLGYLGNLTFHGLLVIGEKPLDVNARYTLQLDFPDALPDAHTRQMIIEARVARCIPDPENPREYNIGFEFLHVTQAQTNLIQSLLERYHFRYQD
ncbi:MAG: hypothetical protein DDG60_03185 [Anaerolineae bacterium]|nr:MAG: hypothetical protein DDG60_03185 [Anaerolineae bacterium]